MKQVQSMKIIELNKYLFLVLIIVFSSCKKEDDLEPVIVEPPQEEFIPNYTFFVVGHTYGHPQGTQKGLYLPFVEQIPFINDYPNIGLGILTGDVVRRSTQESWDSVQADIDKFFIPIHIAAGNHDRGPIFENLYPYFYSFVKEDDLFIILSPTNWNIEGAQKEFLMETIDSASADVKNIFIFCHELIWWSPDNKFGKVKINYAPHYPGSTNYWSEISPYLETKSNNIVIFAGDLGATTAVSPYMYYNYGNITLIANGMGGGEQDNIIITEVSSTGELNFKLLGINEGQPYELAELEEYELP